MPIIGSSKTAGCGDIVIQSDSRQWLLFTEPHDVLVAVAPAEIPSLLNKLDVCIAEGNAVAGFITYEAASGIDPVLATKQPGFLPLAWFGVYSKPRFLDKLPEPNSLPPPLKWALDVTPEAYSETLRHIKSFISAGDTYQVNYTVRLHSPFAADAYALFYKLQIAQQAGYGAYVDIGDAAICSASPELFFQLNGDRIMSRPMKGTIHRAPSFEEDQKLVESLRESAKNRAENVMIVDMIRNDLGRVAEGGSVEVESLYDVERYPTVSQMTSTVRAKTNASLGAIVRALFPCASITGAPKVRTMEIIRDLEDSPRGIYTGAIGYGLPNRQARFNVAIRTVSIDRNRNEAIYGVGGGVVWDSVDSQELAECFTKAEVLNSEPVRFRLLETVLWTPADGFFLLELHLARAERTAAYFNYPFDADAMRAALMDAVKTCSSDQRVRWTLGSDGDARIEVFPVDQAARLISKVALVNNACDSRDPFVYHKTTKRQVYDTARNSRPKFDDVLLVNERGEVTESTIANVVIELDGRRVTPPVSCGLLAGTFREELLRKGDISEQIVTPEMVLNAERVWLINSVRRWIPVTVSE